MKTKKANYNFTSKKLAEYDIELAAFVEDPAQAVFDTACEIGENKGYGSEGIGELNQEIWADLGVPLHDYDDVEFISNEGDEGLTFTIDGKSPKAKLIKIAHLEKAIAAARAEVKRLEKQLKALL